MKSFKMEIIMKKYTIVTVFLLASFSVQSMQKITSSAQAALRGSQAFQQMRSKVSLAALRDMQVKLPIEAATSSPLLGAVSVLNGTRSRELQQGDRLTASFLNQASAEDLVRFTVAPGNPARYLNCKIAGELLALYNSGDLDKKDFFESSTYKGWRSLYTGSRDATWFAAEVRKLLNRIKKEPDQEKIKQLFATVPYFVGDSPQDLETFLKASNITFKESPQSNAMKEYAEAFFELTTTTQDMSFLQAAEIPELAGRCGEKALWTFLNVIFYNPKSDLFDKAQLPVDIQLSAELLTFLTTYPSPTVRGFYTSAAKDFLNLVDGIPGVNYQDGKKYEIPGDRTETLKILNHLLFSKDGAKTFQELAKRLSVDGKRIISIQEPSEPMYGKMKVTAVDLQDEYKVSADWNFIKSHVYFLFDKNKKQNHDMKKLIALDESIGQSASLVKLVPGYLHRLIAWGKNPGDSSISHVEEILKKYKVTKAELNELSQGLAEKKCTLLHTAIEKERADLVGCFLEQGSDPNVVDSNGDSPLVLALDKKNKTMVQALVSVGAQVKGPIQYYLLLAVSNNDLEMVRLCLELGVDPNTKDRYGQTVLGNALYNGNKDVVRLLVAAGANINEKDSSGYSPLNRAVFAENLENVRFCLEFGADPNSKNTDGKTALMYALEARNIQISQALIAAGANVNEKDTRGKTVLMHALEDHKVEFAKLFISAGANINECDRRGFSPLNRAVFAGNLELVRLYLELGADLNSKNTDGQTALMYALDARNIQISQALIAAGANVNEKDTRGKTVLMHALEDHKVEFAKLFISAGANINECDWCGFSALARAAFYGELESVRICLKLSADCAIKNKDGKTALELAKMQGYAEIENLLKDAELRSSDHIVGNARIRETESVMITPSRAEITEGDSYEQKTIREKFSLYVESLYRRYFRS